MMNALSSFEYNYESTCRNNVCRTGGYAFNLYDAGDVEYGSRHHDGDI